MKFNSIIRLSITLTFSFFLLAVNAQTRTVILGKITNPKGKVVKLNYWTGTEQEVKQTTMDKSGNFKIITSARQPMNYDLEHGDEVTHMFLFPGDSIKITLDTKLFDETVLYKGKGSVVNNYLAQQYLYFEKTLESEAFQMAYYTRIAYSDADGYSAYVDSIVQVKLGYLNKHKDGLSEVFYDYAYANIVFRYANDKIDYPSLHYYVRGIQDSVVTVKPEYYHFYDELPYNNEHYLYASSFCSYISELMTYKTKQKLGRDSITGIDKIRLSGEWLIPKIREKFIADLTSRSLDYDRPEQYEEVYAICTEEVKDQGLLQPLAAKYRLKKALMPGNPAPPFKLLDKDGKSVSLADFRGKPVYLDFWASWCGPCMMEMPSSKILQDSFASKDIVFLFISIDENEASWRKTMAAKAMKGVQLRASGWSHEVTKSYGINGIPHYFLIGRDGKIINNNASRPSSTEIYDVLNKALNP